MKNTFKLIVATAAAFLLTCRPASAQGPGEDEPFYRHLSITASPSWQRVYFGLADDNPAYYAAGATALFSYCEQMFGSPIHFLYVGAGASLRLPVNLPSAGRKPDLWGYIEIGWRFQLSRHFAMAPNLDFGLTKNVYTKGTFSAIGCELAFRTGKVTVCLTPKIYYNSGLLMAVRHQIAPAIDLGVRFTLKEYGTSPDKLWL